ncbi:MAG: Jag family protein [Solirubrobacterales bacterium]
MPENGASPLPEEPAARVQAVLERILESLELEASVAVEEDEETIIGTVDGDELGLLIGRHGQTIDAVQLLCFQAAFQGSAERKRVIVDAAGYRDRRRETLERRADRVTEEALSGDRAVELDPMSAAERRVIHEYLRDRAGIETYSEGDEPHRFVVVAPLVSD